MCRFQLNGDTRHTSRKLLAFLLSELNIVRVICKRCGATSELAVDQIASHGNLCRHCNQPLLGTDHLKDLSKTIQRLAAMRDIVEIEFVQPDNSA